jgi:hypothetical protein
MVVQATVTIGCQKCGGTAEVVAGQQYHNCVYCDSLIQLAEDFRGSNSADRDYSGLQLSNL